MSGGQQYRFLQQQLLFRGLRGLLQHHRFLQHLPRTCCRLKKKKKKKKKFSNTTGYYNTFLGYAAGYSNTTGSGNVFIGYAAGYNETGSDKLYIDNCLNGYCSFPLIYGEFDNHLLEINGEVGIAANGASKSQLHFSLDGSDVGGWLTSVMDNNFFVSSGAAYDATAGGWVQKSADGKAVMAGSGGLGYRDFTSTGAAVGNSFAPSVRLHIDYSGNVGINTAAVAGVPISTATGRCSRPAARGRAAPAASARSTSRRCPVPRRCRPWPSSGR